MTNLSSPITELLDAADLEKCMGGFLVVSLAKMGQCRRQIKL